MTRTLTGRIGVASARLRAAERTLTPVPPLRHELPPEDLQVAYAIQKATTDFYLAEGRRVAGHKVGLTNPAVQRQFGVHQPDFGVLWADRAYADREPIPRDHILQPRMEAEIALILDRDVDVARPGPADLIRAIGYLVPAIEVLGSRIADWQIGIVDTIADNASGGGFVLGTPAVSLDGVDLAAITMQMTCDGRVVSAGSGRDCLGNPLSAAVWLARTLAELGEPLRAGEVVLTGSLGPVAPAQHGHEYVAHFGGLGTVTATLGDT